MINICFWIYSSQVDRAGGESAWPGSRTVLVAGQGQVLGGGERQPAAACRLADAAETQSRQDREGVPDGASSGGTRRQHVLSARVGASADERLF